MADEKVDEAAWRDLVKPLFLEMHRAGLDRVVIDRHGTWAKVTLESADRSIVMGGDPRREPPPPSPN